MSSTANSYQSCSKDYVCATLFKRLSRVRNWIQLFHPSMEEIEKGKKQSVGKRNEE